MITLRGDWVGWLVVALLWAGIPAAIGFLIAYRRWHQARRELNILRAAVDKLHVGVALFNVDATPLYLSKVAEWLGVDSAHFEKAVRDCLSGKCRTLQVLGRGDLKVEIQAYSLTGSMETVLLTLRDVTRSQLQFLRYKHVIDTISHDVPTVLSHISSRLKPFLHEDIHKDIHDSTSRREAVREALTSVEWVRHYTEQLLALSRLEHSPRSDTNLVQVAEQAMLQLTGAAEARNITLDMPTPPLLPWVRVVRESWQAVFLNLVSNGIKYGKEGGSVTISFASKAAFIEISVADDGTGIPQDVQSRIFNNPTRAEVHGPIPGTGLGLWLVKQIVDEHGGQISFRSEPGEGSTFVIVLPVEGQAVTRP